MNATGIMLRKSQGAMVGGLLEYNSMKFGFLALYVLGIAVYALAAISYFFSRRLGSAK